MRKKLLSLGLAATMVLSLAACGSKAEAPAPEVEESEVEEVASEEEESEVEEEVEEAVEEDAAQTTVYIDIAASLEAVFVDKIIPAYEEANPNVKIEYNTGSSGKLLQGIEEANGIGHDLFFSAGKKQVTTLDETDGLVKADSIVNLLSNQLCLVKGNDVETAVTSWDNLSDAKTAAICGGSVPVGKYTRIAMVSLGLLEETDAPEEYTSQQISEALGGVEVDEADDVEVAASKAVEGSVEIATIYYSDFFNHQNDLTIIAQDDGTLTGPIVYPVCLVENSEADEAEIAAAADFLEFLQNDFCLAAYEEYCFIVNQ
ncbi:MAG: extracellular solute-binding protein [Lachnospiraceae bacterium]|nr:extracellular solute-binding protein [Candidatus Equihabitans merdae]